MKILLRIAIVIIAMSLTLQARLETAVADYVECGSEIADHILITAIKTGPTQGEFVEIYNPTDSEIALSDYYLYNATSNNDNCFYYIYDQGVCGSQAGSRDFSIRFPNNAIIEPGEYQLIALTGAPNYCSVYFADIDCVKPTYEIPITNLDDPTVINMRGNWEIDISVFTDFGFLDSTSEDIVLFWADPNYYSPVVDIDYVIWGDNLNVRSDKTGILGYFNDTPIEDQNALLGNITPDKYYKRVCKNEGNENLKDGNGITGHDETSEDFSTWVVANFQSEDPVILLLDLAIDVNGVGPGNSLADKVALALAYYIDTDLAASCSVLDDFLSQLNAQSGKMISIDLAEDLNMDVESIIDAIGCY